MCEPGKPCNTAENPLDEIADLLVHSQLTAHVADLIQIGAPPSAVLKSLVTILDSIIENAPDKFRDQIRAAVSKRIGMTPAEVKAKRVAMKAEGRPETPIEALGREYSMNLPGDAP